MAVAPYHQTLPARPGSAFRREPLHARPQHISAMQVTCVRSEAALAQDQGANSDEHLIPLTSCCLSALATFAQDALRHVACHGGRAEHGAACVLHQRERHLDVELAAILL